MFKYLLLLVLFLTGCASVDLDGPLAEAVEDQIEQGIADGVVEGIVEGVVQDAVADAVVDALADDEEEEPVEEEVPAVEYAENVYQPDPSNPFAAPNFNYSVRADDPYYAPVIQHSMQPTNNRDGGIYQVGQGDVFFTGQTARRIGDILTIDLNETTTSTKSNDATISKAASGALANPTVMGTEIAVDSELPEGGADFTGSAAANQSNSLNGTITVTVYDVYPNGVLAVRGEKWVTLNRGEEYIRLTGLVRRQDISPENTVASSRIADARITYSGTGEIATGSEQGWVSRFLNSGNLPN